MTDLATRAQETQEAADADLDAVRADEVADTSVADTRAIDAVPSVPADPPVEWAPVEEKPKKRRLGLWIGIPVGAVVLSAGVASAILIAPGVTIGGVPVSGLTAGGAADAVTARLAETTIVLDGAGGGATITGADLGASVDAAALGAEAFGAHPLWNIPAWNPEPIEATVTIDPVAATEALREAAPGAFTDPVDAVLAFDAETSQYVATPGELGIGIDVDAVHAALQEAFTTGATNVTLDVTPVDVQADIPTYVADASASIANRMIANAGFYVGEERTVPVDAATAASWFTAELDERGALAITADAAAIEGIVPGLPEAVNRDAVNAKVIVNNAGRVLRENTEGVSGRALSDTSTVAQDYAAQLEAGDAVFQLPVEEVPFETVSVVRLLEVDLSEQRLYLKENGTVVDSWLISSGRGATPTYTGRYTINSHLPSQTMRGYEKDANGNRIYDAEGNPVMYTQPNVKSVMYFNGDQAFHGVYWHSNWGRTMSHGCVGMPEWRAAQLYEWSANGTDVWIHQ